MPPIPQSETTISRIYRDYQERENGRPRAHLGASLIGRPCEREAWYAFRWALNPDYEGRLLRLFDRGKREEPAFIHDLRAAGVTVHAVDPATGRQFTFSDLGGHFGGSMDGAAVGLAEAPKTWHVLELKTHSAASFAALAKDGVEIAHPEHFAQMQMYMGWSGMDRAYYLAVNKNTDDLYGERIAFERAVFEKLREKARRIVFAPEPPPRIAEASDDFRCRLCLFHRACHEGAFPRAHCRTCAHSTPREDGTWNCGRHDRTLTVDEQRAGCGQHLFIPPLLPLEPLQGRPGWVCYHHAEGVLFNVEVGAAAPHDGPQFASTELQHLRVDQLPAVIAAKLNLGGTVTDAP